MGATNVRSAEHPGCLETEWVRQMCARHGGCRNAESVAPTVTVTRARAMRTMRAATTRIGGEVNQPAADRV